MEHSKRKRTSLRIAFSKALNSLNSLLEDVASGSAEITVAYALVADKHKELEDNAESILDALFSEKAEDDEVQKEIDEHDVYKSRFLLAKYKFDSKMAARSVRSSSASPANTASNSVNQTEARKTYNLPKIELVKFNGNVREWLQFWSLFKKIHEDVNMSNEDKFQYLIQAMVPCSRAAELVKSYPPTSENYEKAIDSLKKRFGRDDLQIEVYVRELLQLVLQNAMSSKEVQLASLYDKIESYLRALDTLGVTTDKCADVSLHTFVDASKLAYAAVIFIRVQKGSDVRVYFVQAKTRVAPAIKSNANKSTSIPRLELLAATIGARLTSQVLKAVDFKGAKTYYWTDSSTVVAWINRKDNWSIFVSNRVKEIRDISESKQWRHIPGHLNPADLPSRGCTVNQLLASRWWEGLDWLKESKNKWPTANEDSVDEAEVNSELKKSTQVQSAALISVKDREIVGNDNLFYQLSSYSKVVRVIGWIKRFIHNCKEKREARKANFFNAETNLIKINFLTADEYYKAENGLIKMIETRHFDSLEDERIRDFLPFIDSEGLIRIKSKLLYRDDSFNFRCPVILPSKEYFVELLIREKHVELKHAGAAMTLNVLREKFWILRGRKVVRDVIKKCVDCRRHDSKKVDTHTAPLPLDRVRDAAIFEVIGVDFAGPIYLKGGQKAWICIFTCAVYRAVHLELVNSLNVASFLMALRRHVARRGRPRVIFSDNGTNFVGLSNQLKALDYEKIAKTLAIQQIEWRFNPPSAPWWGGFWERLIGVLKRLLRRTLKKSCLNYEEMLTTLTDCEAVINSRPITYLPDSHDEIVPLTPSMFLQEVSEIGVIDLDKLERVEMNKRFTYRQKIQQDLRQRFRNEYLGALTHQKCKSQVCKELEVGDVVLVGNDNAKCIDWPLAKVKELYVGKDGHIRVARLITATGEITRPIRRLYPLELNADCKSENAVPLVTKKLRVAKTSTQDDKPLNEQKVDDIEKQAREVKTSSGRISKIPNRLTYN